MKKRNLHLLIATLSLMALTASITGCGYDVQSTDAATGPETVGSDEFMTLLNHADDRVLEFVIGPFDMPADGGHLRLPIQKGELPFDFYGNGFEWEIRSGSGEKLPDDLLHHMNVIDVDGRELFSPVARRIIAAGRETSSIDVPSVVGIPIQGGHRVWVVSMFGNSLGEDFTDAYLHVKVKYSLPEDGIIPTMEVYTFYMDVTGFVGPKDFPLPPGHTVVADTASPGVDGKILGIGGHLHNYATDLRLEDITTGEVVWEGKPELDESGKVVGVERDLLLAELGKDIYADRDYRIVVEYHNPTDMPAADGGMGAIGGIMTVSGDLPWPAVDLENEDYLVDLDNTLKEPERMAAHGHGGHGGHEMAPMDESDDHDMEGHDMEGHQMEGDHEGHDMESEEKDEEMEHSDHSDHSDH